MKFIEHSSVAAMELAEHYGLAPNPEMDMQPYREHLEKHPPRTLKQLKPFIVFSGLWLLLCLVVTQKPLWMIPAVLFVIASVLYLRGEASYRQMYTNAMLKYPFINLPSRYQKVCAEDITAQCQAKCLAQEQGGYLFLYQVDEIIRQSIHSNDETIDLAIEQDIDIVPANDQGDNFAVLHRRRI